MLQMGMLLQPLVRLLGRRNTHCLRMGRHGGLRVHGGRVRTKVRHGVHVPLQTLDLREIRIFQLTDGVGMPGQKIRSTLRRIMTVSAIATSGGKTDH